MIFHNFPLKNIVLMSLELKCFIICYKTIYAQYFVSKLWPLKNKRGLNAVVMGIFFAMFFLIMALQDLRSPRKKEVAISTLNGVKYLVKRAT